MGAFLDSYFLYFKKTAKWNLGFFFSFLSFFHFLICWELHANFEMTNFGTIETEKFQGCWILAYTSNFTVTAVT